MPLHASAHHCTLHACLCMPLHVTARSMHASACHCMLHACHCMLHARLCMPLHVTACSMHAFACLCTLLHAPCMPLLLPSQSPENMNNGQSWAPRSSLFIDTCVLYYVLYGYVMTSNNYRIINSQSQRIVCSEV